jgi:hypothetical protein
MDGLRYGRGGGVRSTRGALPVFRRVGFPESPAEPGVPVVPAPGSPQVPLWVVVVVHPVDVHAPPTLARAQIPWRLDHGPCLQWISFRWSCRIWLACACAGCSSSPALCGRGRVSRWLSGVSRPRHGRPPGTQPIRAAHCGPGFGRSTGMDSCARPPVLLPRAVLHSAEVRGADPGTDHAAQPTQ